MEIDLLKILQVSSISYPIYCSSGSARVAYDVSKMLAHRGHQVLLFATNRSLGMNFFPDDIICNYNRIKMFHAHRMFSSIFDRHSIHITSYNSTLFLKKVIKTSEIIHIHDYRSLQSAVAYKFAKKYGVPFVLQAHGSLPRIMAKHRLKWIYDVFFGYKLLRDASKVIALSSMEAKQYRYMGVPEEKIEVIPNGIDLSKYGNLPSNDVFKKKFNIDEDKKIILYLGRITHVKGINFLMKAYTYLIRNMTYNNVVLVIAGPDSGYLGTIRELADSLKIADNVVFTGVLSENEKISAYVDSSIVVNVEPRNVFGLVPLEAVACATPVVVSKGNAISEVICDGKFGFSVKYGDVNELAETMGKMLTDSELLREMGQRGRRFVFGNCNWTDAVTKLEKVYEKIINC